MAKSSTIRERVRDVLANGPKMREEIYTAVQGKKKSISSAVSRMLASGEIEKMKDERLRLKTDDSDRPLTENPREDSENTETINRMLNLYDAVLDNLAGKIKKELLSTATLSENIDLIKSLRWLGATLDQLMKRWYLVHRGYDTNTRQAQEDAKQKTADREKTANENADPEDHLIVVQEYGEGMREILASMEAAEKEAKTV